MATSAEQQEFINKVPSQAMQDMRDYGIPASVTIAQAILETGYGTSFLSRNKNNYFGLTVSNSFASEHPLLSTGKLEDTTSAKHFRVYDSLSDSFAGHARTLLNPHYASCFAQGPSAWEYWCDELMNCGYGERIPGKPYEEKLKDVIRQFNLHERFDVPVINEMQASGRATGPNGSWAVNETAYAKIRWDITPEGLLYHEAVRRGEHPQLPPENERANAVLTSNGRISTSPAQQTTDTGSKEEERLTASEYAFPTAQAMMKITSEFHAPNRATGDYQHEGTDFGMPIGTALYATENNGKVIKAQTNNSNSGAGTQVVIEYGEGDNKHRISYYHLSKLDVKEGDIAQAGTKLGESGNTGRSTGPHLHLKYEVFKDGQWETQDPELYLAEITYKGNLQLAIGSIKEGYRDLAFNKALDLFREQGIPAVADPEVSAKEEELLAEEKKKEASRGQDDITKKLLAMFGVDPSSETGMMFGSVLGGLFGEDNMFGQLLAQAITQSPPCEFDLKDFGLAENIDAKLIKTSTGALSLAVNSDGKTYEMNLSGEQYNRFIEILDPEAIASDETYAMAASHINELVNSTLTAEFQKEIQASNEEDRQQGRGITT